MLLLNLLRTDFFVEPEGAASREEADIMRESVLQTECLPGVIEGLGRAAAEGALSAPATQQVSSPTAVAPSMTFSMAAQPSSR